MLDFITLTITTSGSNKTYPFLVDDPQPCSKSEIGSGLQRSLSGKGSRDYITTKRKWTYDFILNTQNLARLSQVYDAHGEITLVDHYGNTATVMLTSDWQIVKEGKEDNTEVFTTQMVFEEL
jgi:hypothetical protein